MGRRRAWVYAVVGVLSFAVLVGGYLAGGAARDVTPVVILLPPLTLLIFAIVDQYRERRDRDRAD